MTVNNKDEVTTVHPKIETTPKNWYAICSPALLSLAREKANCTFSSVAKKPAASTPQIPQAPCTGNASNGSSILKRFSMYDAETKTNAEIIPIKNAAQGSTTAHPAVIPTSPAKTPFK